MILEVVEGNVVIHVHKVVQEVDHENDHKVTPKTNEEVDQKVDQEVDQEVNQEVKAVQSHHLTVVPDRKHLEIRDSVVLNNRCALLTNLHNSCSCLILYNDPLYNSVFFLLKNIPLKRKA